MEFKTLSKIQQEAAGKLGAYRATGIAALVNCARSGHSDINGILVQIRRLMVGELTKGEIEEGHIADPNRFMLAPSKIKDWEAIRVPGGEEELRAAHATALEKRKEQTMRLEIT